MLSPLKMRAQVIKYSKLSALQPDYYFIQGYFMGLATCPDLIVFSRWLADLFGEVNFEDPQQFQYIEAVQQLYNNQMEKVLLEDLKLPAKCVLSKTKFEDSLAKGQPLPQWCLGTLKALKLIDKRTLNKEQKQELKDLTDLLTGYTSINHARKRFSILSGNYQYHAHEYKRMLTTFLNNTIYVMRFADDVMPEFDDFDAEYDESDDPERDAFDEVMNFAMTNDTAEVVEMIDEIVAQLEQAMGPQFFEQNSGFFWGLHETRPYMTLRARRAELNFMHGHAAAAIAELQQLLVLNKNDNQGNRYPLLNYLIIAKRWQELDRVILNFEGDGLFFVAAQALASYAQLGDCQQSNDLKRRLKKANQYFERYITGQRKPPKEPPEFYQPGEKTEVFSYLEMVGKEAWRSVEGSLFWLRKK